jgi:hypothetical protein
MPAIKHNVLATSTGHGFSRKLFAFLNPEILTRFAFLGQGVVYALAFAQFLTITVLLVSVHISVLLLVGTWLALIYTFTAIWRWAARELHYYWTDMTDFFTVIWRAFEEELARTASPRPWYRYPGDHVCMSVPPR